MKNEDGQYFAEFLFLVGLLILIILIILHFVDQHKVEDLYKNDFYEVKEFDGKTYLIDKGIWGGWLEYEP